MRWYRTILLALFLLGVGSGSEAAASAPSARASVLLVTVDTLRADRLSGYGYARPTTPRLDAWMSRGARFTEARTIEPLTTPALCSMLTALEPHQHGSTRNGIRMRRGLPSLPRLLQRLGYRTAAFVGNWTLRDRLSGLAEHFQVYEEVFHRKRWLGLFMGEAVAEDLTEAALAWAKDHRGERPEQPFFLWVHYVDPHAPYRLHRPFLDRLGLSDGRGLTDADRYDTEVAFVDHWIGVLLDGLEELGPSDRLLSVFTADHGESLGEHDYWGHGRNLHEEGLHVPLFVSWPGRIPPRDLPGQALIVDVPRTVLGLLGLPSLETFGGADWGPVLTGSRAALPPRITFYQAHRGAVQGDEDNLRPRQRGLLEVGLIEGHRKEVLHVAGGDAGRSVFDLREDPRELRDVGAGETASPELIAWLEEVRRGLALADDDPPPALTEEEIERLRALGYLD